MPKHWFSLAWLRSPARSPILPRPGLEPLEARELLATGLAQAAFLDGVYHDLLGRAPTPHELAAGASQLDSGTTPTQAASQLAGSTEAVAREIEQGYQNVLGRQADTTGLGFWTQALQNGLTPSQLTAALLGSDEYDQQHGGTPQDWLDAVYQSQLGRPLDQTGLNVWAPQALSTVGRQAVAQAIVSSPEAHLQAVGGLYQAILHRPADSAGAAFWATALDQGATLTQVEVALLGSTEYAQLQMNLPAGGLPLSVEATTGQPPPVLPLAFEPNQGQTDPSVQLLAHGAGFNFYVAPAGALTTLTEPDGAGGTQTVPFAIQLLGANPNAPVSPANPLPGKSNYFLGNTPSHWLTNVPNYGLVGYQGIYTGIDLNYTAVGGQPDLTFVVNPGANPSQIALDFPGAAAPVLNAQGQLQIALPSGDPIVFSPQLYQMINGVRTPISGGWVLESSTQVGFQVGTYDSTQRLFIDPGQTYPAAVGATATTRTVPDAIGDTLVIGSGRANDFPTQTVLQPTPGAGADVVHITKLGPGGTTTLYSTYLGGSGSNSGADLAIDAAGNVTLTGHTTAADFPTTAGAFQTVFGGGGNAFITRLNPTGNGLVYSTFLGGGGGDFAGAAVALDLAGNAYLVGNASASGSTAAPQAGQSADFLAQLSPAGNALVSFSLLNVGTGTSG